MNSVGIQRGLERLRKSLTLQRSTIVTMIIAVDFDGTCVTHEYPLIGKDIGAVPILKSLVEKGNKLILLTMRSDAFLEAAVNWFKENDIELWGIQDNPEQNKWTNSRKVYAQVYIDDAALGCPLKFDDAICDRPFVDWEQVITLLEKRINQ